MESLMLLTENRNGDIKGRACADGRKHRFTIKKEDVDSPTIATESAFITLAVDKDEGRYVATFDTLGAYLHTETDEDGIMCLEGALAELVVKVAPKILKNVCHNGQQGKTASIRSNTKGVVWNNTQKTTVLQEYFEGSWFIWVLD